MLASIGFISIGIVCTWLAIGIPFGIICPRMARPDAVSPFEAWLIGQIGGPVGILVIRRLNLQAARKAAATAAEMEARRFAPDPEDAPPPPPHMMPGGQAWSPPPPPSQGDWRNREDAH